MERKYDPEHVFMYHAPRPEREIVPGLSKMADEDAYDQIRDRAKALAYDVLGACPESRERSLALTKLEECVMWANASIARS